MFVCKKKYYKHMQQINTKKKNKKYLVIYKIVNKMISACDALGKDFPCFLLFFF